MMDSNNGAMVGAARDGRNRPRARFVTVVAMCAAAFVAGLTGVAQADSEGPPSNTAAPVVSGLPVAGQTFEASTGAWDGSAPMSYAYEWRRCDQSGANCQAITGATSPTYRLRAPDLDHTLRVGVTATNAHGSAGAQSPQSFTVAPGGEYAGAVLDTPGLLHFWRLGEQAGSSLADLRGSEDAAASNVQLGVPGDLVNDEDTAARFNGTSSSASAAIDLSGTSTLTVEFWLKVPAYSNDDALALEFTPNFNNAAGGFLVAPNESGGKFGVALGSGGGSRNNVYFARPSPGVWHHYAFVMDTTAPGGDQITPYVDGQTVPYTKTESGTAAGTFADSTLYFMSRGGTSLRGTGDLDELAVYQASLSAAAVADHFAAGSSNQAPVASFSAGPTSAIVDQVIKLEATGSADSDGSITRYEWDFDGDGDYDATTTTPKTTHTYASIGQQTIRLRVSDDRNASDTETHQLTVGVAPSDGYAGAVLGTSGLAHYWRLGESTGTTLADIRGSDDAAASDIQLGAPGELADDEDTAAHFDGTSAWASAPIDLSGTDKLTAEFWLKVPAYDDNEAVALEFTSNFNNVPGGFLVDPNEANGKFGVGLAVGSGSRNNVYFARPSAGVWHHYAFVMDTGAPGAEQITPYVDGRPVAFTKTESNQEQGAFANSTLYLMSRGGSSLRSTGDLDELAIYQTPLSAQTIADHYDAGSSNQAPTASFTATPTTTIVDQAVKLDASASADSDGSITKYEWDFDGDGDYDATTTTPKTTHTFASTGDHTIRLRVNDDRNATDPQTHEITVGQAPNAPYPSVVLDTPGLAHYWRLGESTGTTLADIRGSDDATASNVQLGVVGDLLDDDDTAARFSGMSASASAPIDLSGTETLTVEFWLKVPAYTDDDALALEFTPNFNNTAGGFLIDHNEPGGKFGVALGSGGGSRNNVYFNRPSAGEWHHYAFVMDTTAPGADQIAPYVDGQAVAYTKTESGTASGAFADSTLYFMSRGGSSLRGTGDLDELAIYQAPLSAATIADHYDNGTTDTMDPTDEVTGDLIEAGGAWLRSDSATVTAHARDGGSGVARVSVKVDGDEVDSASQSCPQHGCSLDHEFEVDLSGLEEGQHDFVVVTEDAAGNSSTEAWSVGIDRTLPSLEATGALRTETNLTAPLYALDVHATDDSESTPRAGLERVLVKVDGNTVNELPVAACDAAPCQLDHTVDGTYRLVPSDFDPGSHVVRVEAVDGAGNTAATSWSVEMPDPDDVASPLTASAVTGTEAAAAADQARVQDEQDELQTPQAAAEREVSQTAYSDLSASEAKAVMEQREPDMISKPGFVDLDAAPAPVQGEALDQHTLRVEDANGDPTGSVITSQVPLAYKTGTGSLQTIDLALQSTSDSWDAQSTPVDTELPKQLEDGLGLTDALSDITVAPVDVADATGTKVDKGVFYANVDADTDLFVKPIVGGVETFSILRSQDSPQELRIKINAPGSDDSLVEHGADEPLTLENGGERQAAVGRAVAWDADHQPVQVATEADGNDLVLTVHHQSEDVHYPIVVDPYLSDLCWRIVSGSNNPGQPDGCQVNEWEESWGGRYGTDFGGWSYVASQPNVFAGAAYGPDGYLGAGLYIRDLFVPHTFTPGENGYWVWWAPPGVTIDWTLFRAMSQDNLAASPTCLVAGMTSSTTSSGWASASGQPYINCTRNFYNVDNWYCPGGQCNRNGGAYGGRAIVFQAWTPGTQTSNYFMQHLGGVVAELHETHAPYTATSIPAGPLRQTDVMRFNTVDEGLGLKQVKYWSDDPNWTAKTASGANANHIPTDGTSDVGKCGPLGQLPCPHLIRDDIKVNNLAPGTRTVYVEAKDMAGNLRTSTYTVTVAGPVPFVPYVDVDKSNPDYTGDTVSDFGAFAPGSCSTDCDTGTDAGDTAKAASTSEPIWGISDQNLFGLGAGPNAPNWTGNPPPADADPRFLALMKTSSHGGVQMARAVVSWNIALQATNDPEAIRFDVWYRRVTALNLTPMVSFEYLHSVPREDLDDLAKNRLPTEAQYALAMTRFRARYPGIKYFTAWNEPNHSIQPTQLVKAKPSYWTSSPGWSTPAPASGESASRFSFGAALAARYWRILRNVCTDCKVAAGDLLDNAATDGGGRTFTWTGRWGRTYKRFLLRTPKTWAYHPYGAVRANKYAGANQFLSSLTGSPNVWMTEVGVLHRDPNTNQVIANPRQYSTFLNWARSRAPITRVITYQFMGGPGWDTGLVDYATIAARPPINKAGVVRDRIYYCQFSDAMGAGAPGC